MFENASLVERFLNYWRSTGHQRIGYLYGRYEVHSDVPLGIRAVVAAIYEPPQVHSARTIFDKSINIHFWLTKYRDNGSRFFFWSGKYKRHDKTSAGREGSVSRGIRPDT